MRDGNNSTRYFSFDLPKLSDGEIDERFGVKKAVLTEDDIKDYFDTPYHNFIQGACFNDGKIYSTEGFNETIHPAIRVIDTNERRQTLFFDFCEAGMPIEAEFIDFYNGNCYYGDAKGRLFLIESDA